MIRDSRAQRLPYNVRLAEWETIRPSHQQAERRWSLGLQTGKRSRTLSAGFGMDSAESESRSAKVIR
jgi:hypothetical protein